MPAFPSRCSRLPGSLPASAGGAASSTPRTPAKAGTWTGRPVASGSAPRRPPATCPGCCSFSRTRTCSRRGPRAMAPPGVRAATRSRPGPAAGSRGGTGSDARLRHLPLAPGRLPGTARGLDQPAVPPVPVHREARRSARPGVREGLLPSALLGEASVQGGHRRAHRRHVPRPAGTGGAGLPRRNPVQRPERPVLHPHPGTRHRHRRAVRGHPRLGAAQPGQLRAARGPRGTAHRERVLGHLRRTPGTRAVLPSRAPRHDRGRDRAARMLPVRHRDPPPPVPRPPGRPGGAGPVRRDTPDAATGVGAVRRDRLAEPAP